VESDDDNELIGRYLSGDPEAMERLIERYRKKLFGYIYRMVSSHADADDIFQDVWMKVIRKIEGYRPESFSAWLMTLTRNIVIDRIRSQKPTSSLDEINDSGAAMAEQIPSIGLNPVELSSAKELGIRIELAIAGLPLDQREVFLLRTQMDLGFKEIASMQGVSINTALARMQYGLDKLRKVLQGEYEQLGNLGR
jgi:RNA polymerase sigma-70 factor (ECF subfamily)